MLPVLLRRTSAAALHRSRRACRSGGNLPGPVRTFKMEMEFAGGFMTRVVLRMMLSAAVVCVTAASVLAQTSATTSETKKFHVIAVDGNQLVVKLPEGTRELTVPDDFRFNVDGKMLSVSELKPGMNGTATITTKTTVTPVTVTEVKNGTVMQNMGSSVLVKTEGGMKMFSQGDMDKRGVKIMKNGKVADISDLHANDRLTATIITSHPPKVMTEKQVQATLARPAASMASGSGAGAPAPQRTHAPPHSPPPTRGRSGRRSSPGPRPRAGRKAGRGEGARPPPPLRLRLRRRNQPRRRRRRQRRV